MPNKVSTKEQTLAQNGKPKDLLNVVNGMFSQSANGGMRCPKAGFKTYRQMRENPTIALARMVATAPIRTAEWTLEADDGTPEEQVDFLKKNLDMLWHNLINDSLLALDYGFAPAELIYDTSEGQVILARVKPLLVDKTKILTDKYGNFIGLRNEAEGAPPVNLDENEAFLYTYDCEAGNLYGRPRHENIRSTAYCEWVDIQKKRSKYFKKSSGAVPQVHYPDGEAIDSGGARRPNFELAREIIQNLQEGNGVLMPTILKPWAAELARDGKAGADMEAWTIDFLETKAQHGAEFTEAMKHCESLMMRGWLIPERSATEAQTAGSRADSETAADWAMVAADLTLHDITQSVNAQIVEPLLRLNFGENAVGTIRLKRAGITPSMQAFFRALIQSTLQQPANMSLLLRLVDLNALVSAAGLPKPKNSISQEELIEISEPKEEEINPEVKTENQPMPMTRAIEEAISILKEQSLENTKMESPKE